MLRIILLFSILTTFLFADFKLGIPKNPVSKTFDLLINNLKRNGILEKNNIKVIKVDMKQKDKSKLKKEIESVDLFFITGSYFKLYFNTLKPNTKTVVIGTKKITKIPKFYNDKLVGIYRAADMENLLDLSKGNKIGILAKSGSSFDKHRVKDIINSAKKNNVNMVYLSYKDKKDLEKIFKENKGKLSFIQLWPPSINKKLLPYVIKLQFKYNIPVFSQRMSQVKKGAALGYVLDYDIIIPEIADYIDKISQGVNIIDLKSKNAKRLYVLNMKTITKMGLKFDKSLIRNSKIVGFEKQKNIDLQNIDLKKGNFTIAMPKDFHTAYQKVVFQLALKGYVEGKNLKVIRFDTENKNYKLPKGVDLVFSVANVLNETLRIKNNEPMVILSISSNKKVEKVVKNNDNIISVTLPDKNLQGYIKDIFPNIKNLKVIGNKKAKLPMLKKGIHPLSKSKYFVLSSYLYENSVDLELELSKLNNKTDAVLLMPPSLIEEDLKELIKLQNKYKLLIVSQLTSEVKGGLSLSITADIDKVAQNIAELSHQILQGIDPKDCKSAKINLEFFINLEAIKNLGIELPPKILRNAKVILK
jgi:ABC-type uncharacterized transport system substrate-binding protein